MRHHRSFAALAPLALVAATLPARAQQLIVIGAPDGFAYARGAIVAAETAIKLPPGATLTLIDATGKGVTIHGPYDGPIAASAPAASGDNAALTIVSAILNSPQHKAAAVVRGGGTAPRPPDADEIDVSSETTQCAARGRDTTLWRPPPEKYTTLILTRLATNQRVEVTWPADTATLAWPSAMPRVDGEAYQAMMTDTRRRARVTLKLVDLTAPSIATAKRLADAGCQAQAETMLSNIASPPDRPSP